MINHEKQQRLQGAAGLIAPRHDGDLLTADQFARLTPTGRRDYLAQLDERTLWAQARVIGQSEGKTVFAVIAEWTQERGQ